MSSGGVASKVNLRECTTHTHASTKNCKEGCLLWYLYPVDTPSEFRLTQRTTISSRKRHVSVPHVFKGKSQHEIKRAKVGPQFLQCNDSWPRLRIPPPVYNLRFDPIKITCVGTQFGCYWWSWSFHGRLLKRQTGQTRAVRALFVDLFGDLLLVMKCHSLRLKRPDLTMYVQDRATLSYSPWSGFKRGQEELCPHCPGKLFTKNMVAKCASLCFMHLALSPWSF